MIDPLTLLERDIETDDYLIAGPVIEPLDLDEIKKQRRFSSTSLDTLFDLWTSAARQDFENLTGITLTTTTREYALDAFPVGGEIELPRPPLLSIVSVTYDDGDGVAQTFDAASYTKRPQLPDPPQFDTYPTRGRLALVTGASWPSTISQPKCVRVRYTCGFGAAPGAVPELIKYALYLFVGAAHTFGEEVIESKPGATVQRLPLGAQQVIANAKYTALPTLIPRRW